MSKSLRELADVHYGKSPKDVLHEDGSVPIVGTGGIYGRSEQALFQGPAVVVPRKGSLGNPQYMDTPFWPVDTTYAILPKPGVDARWLYYNLDRFDLTKLNEATGVPSISRDWLYKVPFADVDYANQQEIAEILSTVDEAIEQTEALIAKTQQIKAGLMHDLFTRGVTKDGQLRPPREEAPHLYKESPLGWIPKGWERLQLTSQIKIIDCKHFTPVYQDDGYPIVRPRNVKYSGLDLSSVDYVSTQDYLVLTESHTPKRGDIVFSRNASFGIPCYINSDLQFAIGQDVVIMTETLADTRFIFYALCSEAIRFQIQRLSGGSTFGRINLEDIRKLLVSVPVRFEQEHIATQLSEIAEQIHALSLEIDKLDKIKAGLMHDLLTGRVRVKTELLPPTESTHV